MDKELYEAIKPTRGIEEDSKERRWPYFFPVLLPFVVAFIVDSSKDFLPRIIIY